MTTETTSTVCEGCPDCDFADELRMDLVEIIQHEVATFSAHLSVEERETAEGIAYGDWDSENEPFAVAHLRAIEDIIANRTDPVESMKNDLL